MKQWVFLITFFVLLLSWPMVKLQAACQLNAGKKAITNITFTNLGSSFILQANGTSRTRNSPQCTTPVSSGSYTISCDEDTETFAADSVFAPLCGSSVERGKANSTCYSCGPGVIKCDGFNWTLGESSPIFDNHERCSFDKDNPNWNGDVWCSPPNPKVLSDKKFIYNGKEYDYNGEQIIACGSNVQACGASEECTNIKHPDVNNRGSNGQAEAATDETAYQKIEGIPVRNPNVPHTEIDSTPGMTAVTIPKNEKLRAGDFMRALISPFFGFPVVDGITKTTETNLDRIKKTVLGTTEPLWDDSGALTGVNKGGKLMPLALANRSLGWPQFKEGQFLTEKTGKRTCAQFGNFRPTGDQGKVSPYMAETEPLKHAYPIAVAGFRIWETFLGAAFTGGVPGLPSFNFVTPRQEWGVYDEQTGKIRLKDSLYTLMFGCGAESSRRQTAAEPFTIFGFLGFGDKNDATSGFEVSATRGDVAGDIFTEEETDSNGVKRLFEYIFLNKKTTLTFGLDAALSFFSSANGMQGSTNVNNIPNKTLARLQQDYKGYVNTFLPLTLSQKLRVRDYDRLAHSATNLSGATLRLSPEGNVNLEIPHAGQKGAQEGFDAGMCMITPLVKQSDPEFFPNDECTEVFDFYHSIAGELNPDTSNWALSQSSGQISTQVTIDNTDVKKAIEEATKDRIPVCVLEAVKYIETGPDWSPPAECKINACSAAGPFQITVGVDDKGSNKCEQCGDSYREGGRTCPDAWPHDWPGNPDESPCNISLAANGAVNLLIAKSEYWTTDKRVGHTLDTSDPASQQPGIILAGNSYYGSSAPIGRLGNCSYGEFVYRNCDPTYVCGSGGNIDF